VGAEEIERGLALEDIRPFGGDGVAPKEHVTDEAVVILHREKAAHVPHREVVLVERGEDEDVKAGVPEVLIGIGAGRGLDVALVGLESTRPAFVGVGQEHVPDRPPDIVFRLQLRHVRALPDGARRHLRCVPQPISSIQDIA
jgi:hypothetical protein